MKHPEKFASETEKESWLEKNHYQCELRWINHELWRHSLNGNKLVIRHVENIYLAVDWK